MSEDPTQNLLGGADTKPSLEAVIHRIDRLGGLMLQHFKVLEDRLDRMDARLDRIDSRLDRIEAMALETRADLRDLKGVLKERLPAVR